LPNNFGAVGWDGDDEAAVVAALDRSIELGTMVSTDEGTTYYVWSDASGAGIATFCRGGPTSIFCAKPFFWRPDAPRFSALFQSVNTTADTCGYCLTVTVEPVECGGMPLIFEVLRPVEVHGAYALVKPGGLVMEVSVAALARSVDVWPDEVSFRAAEPGDAPPFAPRSLIPSGAFGDRPVAQALLHGEVLSASWETNGDTGIRFARLTVATHGLSLDVVCAETLLEGLLPEEGSIVRVSAWLVGTIHSGAPAGAPTTAVADARRSFAAIGRSYRRGSSDLT
jgi:hypothetical protein